MVPFLTSYRYNLQLLLGLFLATIVTAQQQQQQQQQQSQKQKQKQQKCGEINAPPSLSEIVCGTDTQFRSFDRSFDIFCAVIQELDVADALSGVDDDTNFTLFAPTNQGFKNLPEATGYDNILGFLLSDQGQLTLETILLNHFVVGHIISPNKIKCDVTTDTLSGSSVTKCASIVGPIFQVGPGNLNDAFLPKYNGGLVEPIYACNGIMYIMDNVILPEISFDWTPTPTEDPTVGPTTTPTRAPTRALTRAPTEDPTPNPSSSLTSESSSNPTSESSTSLLRGTNNNTPVDNTSAIAPTKPNNNDQVVFSRTNTVSRTNMGGMNRKANTCGQNEAQLSIWSYICWMGNFSLLCSALQKTGLDKLLEGINNNNNNDDVSDVITVYAPVNSGMEKVGLTRENIEMMDVDELRDILKTHITTGFISTEELVCDTHRPTLLGGASLTKIECVDIDGVLTKSIMGFFNFDTTRPILLSPTDIELCNGYVQPIDHVIQIDQISIPEVEKISPNTP